MEGDIQSFEHSLLISLENDNSTNDTRWNPGALERDLITFARKEVHSARAHNVNVVIE